MMETRNSKLENRNSKIARRRRSPNGDWSRRRILNFEIRVSGSGRSSITPRPKRPGTGISGRPFLLLLLLTAIVPWCFAQGDSPRLTHAIQTYERATTMRVQLEARPQKARTLTQYRQLINTYQSVYATDPAYRNAAPALAAVAELHREMGSVLSRPQDFTAAIKAYQFLMTEYPYSGLARQASLAIGEIYRADLNQPQEARQAYQQLSQNHPQSSEAAEARKLIAQLDQTAGPVGSAIQAVKPAPARQPGQLAQHSQPVQPGRSHPASRPSARALSPAASPPGSGNALKPTSPPNEESSSKETQRLAEVQAVRCWEGPGYTRVVIGVESEIKFDASRLRNPDRLVFDLMDTHLSPELAGKTFPAHVFLRRVRIAQFQPNITRAVLDVAQLKDYSVFTLPNPFRVVIDIHGGAGEVNLERQQQAQMQPKPDPSGAASLARGATIAETSRANAPSDSMSAPRGQGAAGGVTKERNAATPAPVEPNPRSPSQAPFEPATDSAVAPSTSRKKETLAVLPAGSVNNGIISEETLPAPHRPSDLTASDHPVNAESDAASGATESRKTAMAANTASLPTSADASTLTRVLGLKIGRIVIDPGHGGHDTGTIGPHGLREKDLVLDVGLRLRKLLEEKAGAEVIMTRSDDTFIPLEERTAIANQKDADLFVSIHANASRDASARGVETYYLNFTSDPRALEVAARENATSEQSVHQLQDLVKKIVLTEKIKESQVFAGDVQHSIYRLTSAGTGQGDRGVKRAPFVVLIGANMPSILAEISFLSNPYDERQLRKPDYRQKIAEALYQGIYRYVSALGGVKLAQNRSQELEVRSEKPEIRSQKSGDGSPKTEVRRRKPEDGSQKPEDRRTLN